MTEQKHEKIAKRAEDISMSATVVSAVISVGANLLEPTGLSALGVTLGILEALVHKWKKYGNLYKNSDC
jgi:hypothetical protein